MPVLRILALAIVTCVSALGAMAQTSAPRIVAVLITSDTGNERAARFEASLQALDAETLVVEAPNDAQLRALLQRFTAVAVDTDVAIIYIDAPILMLGERAFVATPGLTLPRASSLLTRAVPVSAFARAANLAGDGGVVLLANQTYDGALPAGALAASRAPGPRSGIAPVMFMADSAADRAIDIAADIFGAPRVELGALLVAMQGAGDVSISETLARETVLRAPAPVVRATPPASTTSRIPTATTSADPEPAGGDTGAQAETSDDTGAAVAEAAATTDTASEDSTSGLPQVSAEETAAQQTPPPATAPRVLSLEELQALENNLSRTAKRNIQRGLREQGFYRGLIDGLFGRQTRISIEAFQESLGDEPTGVLTVEQLTMFE